MQLPPRLIGEIQKGQVVLVLGAGAVIGAKTPEGTKVPLAVDLRDQLVEEFLGGANGKEPLAFVAELAASEASLSDVQDFIATKLADLQPADFHRLLPTFRWRAIATTNYDLLLERVYQEANKPIQALVPFIDNRDRVDEKLRTRDQLALLKLHGCLTRTHDSRIPLILSPDQYVTHRQGRNRLYDMLKEWAYENHFVFVGHSLNDSDVRTLLIELDRESASRPRFYLVRPGLSDSEKRLWESRRITPLKGTFEDFLKAADSAVPKDRRQLLALRRAEHPIENRFRVRETVGRTVRDLLEHDTEYVYTGMPVTTGEAGRFYRGFDLGWFPIEAELDVRRGLTERILREVIIRPEEDRPTAVDLYAIKAEAGGGKSLLMRRVAWEAARDAEELCLFVRPFRTPKLDALRELQRCTGQRIFLFWDNAADDVNLISELIIEAQKTDLQLTIITAERRNQWNISCEDLDQHLSDAFDLRYLNEREVETLVLLLETHDCLGHLKSFSHKERVMQFVERAGRQLLVALHEATLGKPFQEIIHSEYKEIQPEGARRLYLTVCVLNRFGIPARAGLISRVHGIALRDFRERFLRPLEHVVRIRQDRESGDFKYEARHREIAEIVFQRALRVPADRYDEYVRLLADLNLVYSVDLKAFRRLCRAHDLKRLFPNHQDVESLYARAVNRAPEDAYVLQQMANYERIRPNGSLQKARELLGRARELEPWNSSIAHSLAEVVRAESLRAKARLKSQKLRGEARSLLGPLLSSQKDSLYARDALIKLALDELKEFLDDDKSLERDIDRSVRNVEKRIQEAAQRHPNEERFLTAEASFSDLLNDHERAFTSLKRAFEKNPRDPYIAGRFSRNLERRGDLEGAATTVRSALEGNRGDPALNYRYAELLRRQSLSDRDELIYHYRRAFTPGDKNYSAQFWYARYGYESKEETHREESKGAFKALRAAPIRLRERHKIRDYVMNGEQRSTDTGSVARLEEQHGFLQKDRTGDWIFFHKRQQKETEWDKLQQGARVAFEVGFSFSGPMAVGINVL